jgi:hypothetical protein
VSRRAAKTDRRLLGTWQSDRRRTFRHFKPKPGCSPHALRKLKGLFGKLVVRWGRGVYVTELDGHQTSVRYEVVATDAESVVVRFRDELSGSDQLQQIHFAGDYYWIALTGGAIFEFFRRVPRAAEPSAAADPAGMERFRMTRSHALRGNDPS